MGTWFTTLHVAVGQARSEAVQHTIIETLRKRVLAGPFVEVPAQEGEIDRSIRVGPAEGQRWITVEGSLTESAGEDELQQCAQELSRATGQDVIISSVYDSDALELWLYRDGVLTDRYSSAPGYGGERLSRQERAQLAGHPDVWSDLLVDGATPAMLRDLWKERRIFAEATFYEMAPLLGIEPRYCGGFRPDEVDGIVTLSFRSTTPPRYRVKLEGPPRLAYGSYPVMLEEAVGGKLDNLAWVIHCVGGPGRGVDIWIEGSALEHQLVEVTSVQAWTATNGGSPREAHEAQVERAQSTGPIHLQLPELELPAGIAYADQPLQGWDWRHVLHAQWEASIVIKLQGSIVAPGEGKLVLRVGPLATPETNALEYTLPVAIQPQPRYPLKMHDQHGSSAWLLKLQDPHYLSALVVLDTNNAEAAEAFADAFERWHALLAPAPEQTYDLWQTAKLHLSGGQRGIKARSIPNGRRWQALRKRFSEQITVRLSLQAPLTTREGEPFPPWDRRHDLHGSGGVFETTSIAIAATRAEPAPHIGLWTNLYGRSTEERTRLTEELLAIVDELMARAQGVQAHIACWDGWPSNLDSTLYEIVCGVHGQVTMSQSWCARFLRGVTERLWLGPALLEALGQEKIAQLTAFATVQQVGNGLRIQLQQHGNLNDLERLLEPILAGYDDWSAANYQLYAQMHHGTAEAADAAEER